MASCLVTLPGSLVSGPIAVVDAGISSNLSGGRGALFGAAPVYIYWSWIIYENESRFVDVSFVWYETFWIIILPSSLVIGGCHAVTKCFFFTNQCVIDKTCGGLPRKHVMIEQCL